MFFPHEFCVCAYVHTCRLFREMECANQKLGTVLTDSANLSLNPGCALLLGDIRQVYVSISKMGIIYMIE